MFSRRELLRILPSSLMFPAIWGCDQSETELVTLGPILPYIQNVTTTSATILWQSAERLKGTVQIFNANESLLQEVGDSKVTFHKVTVEDLEEDTTYFYQVKEGSVRVGPMRSFRTALPSGSTEPFKFIVFGDSGLGTKPQLDVANQMLALGNDAAFALHTGDVVYDGYEGEYPSKFFGPYRSLIPRIPFFPVKGDHDIDANDAEAYHKFFALPTNSYDNSSDFYSFSYGNALFIALEAYGILGGTTQEIQAAFLRETLSNSNHTWKFIYLHLSTFTTGEGRDSKEIIYNTIHEIAKDNGVQIIFGGDIHAYERFYPKDGVTYLTTGGGGADLRNLVGNSDVAFGLSEYHFVLLSIDNQSLTSTAYDHKGEIMETFELTAS